MSKKAESHDKAGKLAAVNAAFDPVEAALRQLYDNVASEAIPDDFLKLLDELEQKDRKTVADK